MLTTTYEAYYPDSYKPAHKVQDELVECARAAGLFHRYKPEFSNDSEENVLTQLTSPWLDLGDLPVNYDGRLPESEQKLIFKRSRLPHFMIVPYLLQDSSFDFQAVERFSQYSFKAHGIKETDLNQMLLDMNSLLAPYNIIQNESD